MERALVSGEKVPKVISQIKPSEPAARPAQTGDKQEKSNVG